MQTEFTLPYLVNSCVGPTYICTCELASPTIACASVTHVSNVTRAAVRTIHIGAGGMVVASR